MSFLKQIYCLSLLLANFAWSEHSLTLINGDIINGTILDYQNRSDLLTFRADDGNQIRIKGAQLSDDSFKYVRSWASVKAFEDKSKFRLYVYGPNSINTWIKRIWRRPPGKVEPQLSDEIKYKRIGYDIKYDNQTGFDLENLIIKYCIFYDQARFDWNTEERAVDIIVRPCLEEISILPNEFSEKISLKTVVLKDREHMYKNDGWMLQKCKQDEGRFFPANFIGMILRVEMISPGGKMVVRETRYPNDLSEEYEWLEPTSENIVWTDDLLDEKTDITKPPTLFEEMGGIDEDEEE